MEYLMLIRYGDQYRDQIERASEAELKSVVAEYMASANGVSSRGRPVRLSCDHPLQRRRHRCNTCC
jgi:hypothetical protein